MKDWNDLLKETGSLPSPWEGAIRMPKTSPFSVKVELSTFELGRLMALHHWVGDRLTIRMWACRCPSECLHIEGERFDGSTRLCAPDEFNEHGWINCTHPACRGCWVEPCSTLNAVERLAELEEHL